MKKVCLFSFVIISLFMLGITSGSADPILYLDFDNHPGGTLQSGNPYYLQWDERGTSITTVYTEVLNGDGVDIKIPEGAGVDYPNTEGPQGGKAMHIDAGSPDKEEQFNFEMSTAYHPGDYTVEVVFWLATNSNSGNDHPAAGVLTIQNIWSNSWPCLNPFHAELRNIGDGAALPAINRPADARHIELAVWEGGGTEKRIVSIDEITAQVWHTAQMVFDYNEGNPANCPIEFYLDGTSQGSVTYDATASGTPGGCPSPTFFEEFWGVFGTPAPGSGSCRENIGAWRFILGGSTSRHVNGSDNRGMQGAIDAFCISEGALSPGEFVLPGGWSPPPPAQAILLWQLYE